MNNIFKTSKVIILDDKYSLTPDSGNGVQLQFKEMAVKKNKKTDEMEDVEIIKSLFFTRASQALTRYLELSQNSSQDLKGLIETTNRIYGIIENFDKTFNQYS